MKKNLGFGEWLDLISYGFIDRLKMFDLDDFITILSAFKNPYDKYVNESMVCANENEPESEVEPT